MKQKSKKENVFNKFIEEEDNENEDEENNGQ